MTPPDDPLPDLLRALRGPAPDARVKAAKALGRLGGLAHDALPKLVQTLADPEPAVREAAAQAVGLMGPDAVPHLIGMLSHEDKYVRRHAVWGLGKLGPAAAKAVPHLCASLKDPDPRTAGGAAQSLGALGEDAAAAVPDLTEAMRGTNIVLCRLAAKALSEVGWPALVPLIAHLRHHDPFVRGEAALALGWMGPAAAAAVDGLIEVAGTGDPNPPSVEVNGRTPATVATPAPTKPPTDDASRLHALQALGRIGPAAGAAVPLLTAAAADKNPAVRSAAERSLRQIRRG